MRRKPYPEVLSSETCVMTLERSFAFEVDDEKFSSPLILFDYSISGLLGLTILYVNLFL